MVEFVIDCPVDGSVEATIEDIDAVVMCELETAEIVFTCPVCGSEVRVTVRVPSFLLSAIESLSREAEARPAPVARIFALAVEIGEAELTERSVPRASARDERTEAYCEYFRRQLDAVVGADDALEQIDAVS